MNNQKPVEVIEAEYVMIGDELIPLASTPSKNAPVRAESPAQELRRRIGEIPTLSQLPSWHDGAVVGGQVNPRLKRIKQELALSLAAFSKTRRGDMGEQGHWVCIKDFRLPPGYNRESTELMVKLPLGYPETPPQWFYLVKGLRSSSGAPLHYFEKFVQTADPAAFEKGWAGGCIHIDASTWRPKSNVLAGHSLLTVFHLAYDALARWQRGETNV